jgi:hypothetical protein
VSIEHLAVVLHHSKAKGTRKLVLIGVANHDGDGGAWPSVATLARYAGIQERQVQKHLDALVATGEVARDLQAGGPRLMADHLRPNAYRVLVRCPAWCDRSPEHRDTRPNVQRLGLVPVDKGVSSTTPPPPGGGVLHDTPPVSSTTPEPPLEPNPPKPPPDSRPCRDCGQGEARCQALQSSWAQADRHAYVATPTHHARAHTPATTTRRRRA